MKSWALKALVLKDVAFLFGATAAFVYLTGCAQFTPQQPLPTSFDESRLCLKAYRQNDRLVSDHQVGDAEYARISEFPHLRANRFLAAQRNQLANQQEKSAWLASLSDLDRDARAIENANLPPAVKQDSRSGLLDTCRDQLNSAILTNNRQFAQLIASAAVPDAYRTWQRILGFYPATKLLVHRGVVKLHQREAFSQPANVANQNYREYEINADQDFRIDDQIIALGVLSSMKWSHSDLRESFRQYAPLWRIERRIERRIDDAHRNDDQVGTFEWRNGKLIVSTEQPTVYWQLSHATLDGTLLPQLNYTIWFPRTTATKFVDLYAGRFDGLTFRVTLGPTREPILAEIMHNCGCYYMAFPDEQFARRNENPSGRSRGRQAFEEPIWIPKALPILSEGRRFTIRLAAGNHFVRNLSASLAGEIATPAIAKPYRSLRSLPTGQTAHQSIFNQHGLITGSARLERFILWPMGVPSAGAMRQMGNHAIAFVGRRHFDDADLIDRLFEHRAR